MRRFVIAAVLAVLLLGGVLPFAPLQPRPVAAEKYCFPQNNRCMEGAFRDYWQTARRAGSDRPADQSGVCR